MLDTNNIKYKDIPKPIIKKGELLVRIKSTRVCRTDIRMYRGEMAGSFLPRILGHETAGEVAEVGSEVTTFNVGDRIGIDPLVYCGKCYFCKKGLNNLCVNGGLMGRESNGSFAEYAVITPERAIKIPDSMSFDVACFWEAVGSIYRSICKTKLIRPGAIVVVLGLGSMGMIHIQLIRRAGSQKIIAVDSLPWKLELALELGADEVVNNSDPDKATEIINKLTPHYGADVVIDAVGSPITICQSYDLVRPGGEIIQYGIGPNSVDNINVYLQYYKEITIYGVRAFTISEHEVSMGFIEHQDIKIEPIITHRLGLQETAAALELSEKQTGKVLGVIVNS